jgi:signal transduction histidine kinase
VHRDCGYHGIDGGSVQNGDVARSSIRWGVLARLTLGVVTVLLGVAGVALALAPGPGALTTYAGDSTAAAALAFAPGLALVVGGLILSVAGSPRVVGDLMLVVAAAWFAPLFVGWNGGPPLARSFAAVVAPFTFPLLVHATLAYPRGRIEGAGSRVLVGAAYVGTLVVTLGLALFRDPFFDPYCWANCTDNSFLLRSLPGVARGLELADRWFTVVAPAAFVMACVARVVKESGPARRTLLPVAIPAMLFAGGVAAHAIALQQVPKEDPSDPLFFSTFVVTSGAAALVAGGFLWGFVRMWLQRRAVARIVTSLGDAPAPGSMESALARAVGDSQLRIAYWMDSGQRYVDASGRPVPEPVAVPGRAITALVRGDRRVALVSHATGVGEIASEMGPALRLALENEQLQAERLAQLEELRASRARIVETGDAERRRLERDLHDGAQQRLLAVSYEIRLAIASAEADGDVETGSVLGAGLESVHAALDELRELAHGIYPAILGEAGLAAALATLADTAPLVLDLEGVAGERYPGPVETAAYVVVVEALDDATARGATYAAVTAVRDNDELVVTVEDDGSERTSTIVQLDDRVGALGGRLEVGSMTLRAAIPCE